MQGSVLWQIRSSVDCANKMLAVTKMVIDKHCDEALLRSHMLTTYVEPP